MAHRLKSLELQGYKTFASRTRFEFSKNITAIVGPNGSGKSNITDAIRWVLGEQSFSILRGRKTEDMIFSGSESRPRSSMASATMVFDNTDQWLPIDFSEVAITRRAYRDGQNEYLINGQKVRLKDVNELIASAGLAERTYTVIGQGLVDVALALKAEERRQLFEEAAGIGLYRGRREEALHRLDATRRNLERLQDILSELEPRLRSLEKQVKRFEEVEQIKKDLKVLLLEWYGFHWHKEQLELITAKDVVSEQEKILKTARINLAKKEEENVQIKQQLEVLQNERNELKQKLSELGQQQQKCEQQIAVLQERKRYLEQQQLITGGEITQRKEELDYINKELIEIEAEIKTAEQDFADVSEKAEKARAEFDQKKKEWEIRKQEIDNLSNQQERLIRTKAELEAKINETQQRIHRLEGSISEHQNTIQVLENEIKNQNQSKTVIEKNLQELKSQFQNQQHKLNDVLQIEKELIVQKNNLQEQLTKVETRLLQSKTQYEILEQSDNSLTDYNQAARYLTENSHKFRVLGVLGTKLFIPVEYEIPVAAILGEYTDTILVENDASINAIIDILNQEKLRGILFPWVNPDNLSRVQRSELIKQEGVISWLDELITAEAPFQDAIRALFNNVLLVKDRSVVKQIQPLVTNDITFVTLSGEIYYPNGVIINAGNIEVGKLRRPRQKSELLRHINELDKQLNEINQNLLKVKHQLEANSQTQEQIQSELRLLQQQIDGLEKRLRDLDINLEQSRSRKDWLMRTNQKEQEELRQLLATQETMHNQLDDALHSLEELDSTIKQKKEGLSLISLDALISEINQWDIYVKTAQKTIADSHRRYADKREQLKRLQNSIDTLIQREKDTRDLISGAEEEIIKNQNEKDGFEKLKLDIQNRIQPLEDSVSEQSSVVEKNNSEIHRLQANLIQLEQKFAQARILLTRQQERFETLRKRIEEDFGLVAFEYDETITGPTPLPIEGMVEKLPVVTEISEDLEENIKRYRSQLKRFGPINQEAKLEYDEVKERYQFLLEQIADLEKAEDDIRQIINELDLTMQHDFKTTFELVAEEFKLIFSRLFSGGNARLILTDSDDLTQAGIEIEARLPGKRTQGLSLLSGGERSLTAVALIFALLKISPTPFCVLDEVDAMLDEANVGRFRDLLEELSENTQFIIVTHNRNTVQVADVVYGVTMGRDSTSQVISLRLDEIDQVIQENE